MYKTNISSGIAMLIESFLGCGGDVGFVCSVVSPILSKGIGAHGCLEPSLIPKDRHTWYRMYTVTRPTHNECERSKK